MIPSQGDLRRVRLLWDYLRLGTPVSPAECLLVFGGHDLGVAKRAAELYHDGVAPLVVVSGGSRAVPDGSDFPTEADAIADVLLRRDVPKDAIALERLASNTSENFWFSAELLRDLGLEPHSFLAVTKPYAERRLLATARRRWPHKDVAVTSEETGLDEYLSGGIPPERILSGLAGEALRLESYAAYGLIDARDPVPTVILDAAHALQEAGFNSRALASVGPTSTVPSIKLAEDSDETEGLSTAGIIKTGLLPHLSSRFRRQAEVVAMEVLHWILMTDREAREWFCNRLALLDGNRPPRPLEFQPEIQRDGIRPDLCAIEQETRQEVVLIEAKFWAALQPSQPLGYLKRAQEMLVILGPDQGATTWLWPEICARAGISSDGARELSHVLDDGKRLCYLKWSDVLKISTSRKSTTRAREELEALVDAYGASNPTLIDDAVLGPEGLARTESLMDLVARVRNHVPEAYNLRRQQAKPSAYLQAWHCYGGQHRLHGYDKTLDKIRWRIDLRFSFEEGEGPLVFELELDDDVPLKVRTQALQEVGHRAFRWDNAIAWQLPLRAGAPIDQCVHDAAEAIRDIIQRLTGLHLGQASSASDINDGHPDEDPTPDGV